MKTLKKVFSILLPILFLTIIFTACEGPAGKDGLTGPQGPAGAQGPAGPAGPAGQSGAEQCGLCHNNATALFAVQAQYEESLHATGDVFIYGDRLDCAPCHTSEGFREVKETGAGVVAKVFPHPTTINCRTCHNIHVKYDATDWGLAKTTPIKLYESGESADIGKANLCGQCHQSRAITPAINLASADKYKITSSRWGPHHSPIANFLTGKGVFKANGSKNYPSTNVHGSLTCMNCHMNAPTPALHEIVQGHSFKMTTEDGVTQAVTGCITCHSEVKTKFNDKEGYFDAFAAKMATLKQILIDKGWLNSETGLWKATTAAPIEVTQNQAAAMYTWMFFAEDGSNGIHNPKLATAMIDNAIEELSK